MKPKQAVVRLTAKGSCVEVEEVIDESRAGDYSVWGVRKFYVPCPGTKTQETNDLELGRAVRKAVTG